MPLEDLLTKFASMLVTSYIVHLKRKCVWALVLCQSFFFVSYVLCLKKTLIIFILAVLLNVLNA